MGFLDDLGKVVDVVETSGPVNLVNGAWSAWTDVPNFANDLARGDLHSAVNDGRNIIGDADDVVQGLSSLGVSMGPVPGVFASSKVTKLAE